MSALIQKITKSDQKIALLSAEILNVSRSHVIKLLEKGEIPHKKVGSHRRILLQDILKFESNFKSARRKKLDALAKEAQELNLGYE